MQSRAVTRAAKTEDSSSDAREPEDSCSDESEGEYLKVANEFAARREAAKVRAAENVRRSFKADQDQVSAGDHVEDKDAAVAAFFYGMVNACAYLDLVSAFYASLILRIINSGLIARLFHGGDGITGANGRFLVIWGGGREWQQENFAKMGE